MGIKKFIGKEDDKLAAKKPKQPKKAKTCKECTNFAYYKNIDFETEYYRQSSIPKGTIAFIMSPINFSNLDRKQWKHIICSNLMEYNILFLPFPRCVENVLQKEKDRIALLRSCKDNFILKHLGIFEIDLIVVFDDTKSLLEIDDNVSMDYPGNWARWNKWQVYLAKEIYSPERGGFWQENFQHTVNKIKKYFNKELIWQKNPAFKTVTTIPELEAVIAKVNEQDMVSVDVETSGLDVMAKDFRLKTIGLFWPKEAVCIGYEVEECLDLKYQGMVKDFLLDLLADQNIVKVCHNLKYEMKVFIQKLGAMRFERCEDTMFLAYLFNENRPSNGLKYLAGEYCDGYDKVVKDFAGAGLKDLWFYNCMDAFFTYYLKAVEFDFDKLGTLKNGILYIYHEVMIPECFEVALMELSGVNVDFDYLEKLKIVLTDEVAELSIKMETEFPATKGRNLNAPKQMADILFSILRFPIVKKTPSGAPSTDKETLVTLKELHGCKLAEYILELRKKEKQLSTYVIPYLERRPDLIEGRIRSSYSQVKNYAAEEGEAKGTVTGRLSSANPNLQNISRDKSIKKIFIPSSPKRVFVQSDLSQAELRIAASLAFEEKMLNVYRHDGDLHIRTGLLIAPRVLYDKYVLSVNDAELVKTMLAIGKPKDAGNKKLMGDIRQNGKPGNFGMIYGGSWMVLQRIAKQNYGLDLTKEDAMHAHAAFFAEYVGLTAWHETTHAFIAKYGMSVAPMGRVRRVPQVFVVPPGSPEWDAAMREALNSIVQGMCADFLGQCWVMGMREVRKRRLDDVVRLSVHDNIVGDALNNDVALEVTSIFDSTVKYWTEFHQQYWLQCPMKMDHAIGPHWGALEEQ